MLVSSFCASRPRDATRRMSATELARRSSVAAALQQSSTQLELVVSSPRPSSRCCWQHLEEGRGGTSMRDASCAQHQLRRSSISSVAAALAGDGSVPRRSAVDGGSSFEMQDVQDVHASPMKQLSCEKNKGYRYFLLINELGKVAHISIKMNWGRRPNQGRHGKPTQTGARETHL